MHTPFIAPDRDFQAKAETLYRWWVDHRGAEWTAPAYAWSGV
jgi:hypothetical protein